MDDKLDHIVIVAKQNLETVPTLSQHAALRYCLLG